MITKIAVIGQQCSGKTTLVKMFGKHFDAKYFVKIADPIYDTLNALRKDKHRAFMQQFADLAKKHFGEQVLVEVFKQNVESLVCKFENRFDSVLIACDDIRFPYEMSTVRELGFKLVGIDADPVVRKQRADRLGLEFIENHDSELLVPQILPMADWIIKDDGISMDELDDHCLQIVSRIFADNPDCQPVS